MASKKTRRWNLRVSEELNEKVESYSTYLGKSKNELIESAVWSFLLEKERFAFCPTCKRPSIIISEVPFSSEIVPVECSKGHIHYFDFEAEKWIK